MLLGDSPHPAILIQCDGKPGRQARKILLDPDMRVRGCSLIFFPSRPAHPVGRAQEYGIAHAANSAGVPVTVLYVASGYQADETASVELKPAREW